MRPTVFVSGTWRESKAAPYVAQAEELGRLLARAAFDLACGPGTGIARHVVDGYRSQTSRGSVKYFLPRAELMAAVGEVVGEGADEIIQTDFDYPVRNTWQMGQCHGVVVLTGGDGALEEALPALIDYELPVAVIRNAGPAAAALELLVDVFPDWLERLRFGDSISELWGEFSPAVDQRFGRDRS